MTTNHIKAILTSLRAMVIKMLPAYKFYLGSTTETVATQICHGVMSVKDGQTFGNGALTLDDASFAGFVEGETYTVVVNGVSGEYVAKLLNDDVMVTNIAELENLPEDLWAAAFVQGTCMYSVSGSYANATISISQAKTVTTKKYQAKKLDKSLLPDGVESGIEAANTKAATALSVAQDAEYAANTAQSTANTAQSTAESAGAQAINPFVITWDGDTTGVNANDAYFKVSDYCAFGLEIVLKIKINVKNDAGNTLVISPRAIVGNKNSNVLVDGNTTYQNPIVFVRNTDYYEPLIAGRFPETGIYFRYYNKETGARVTSASFDFSGPLNYTEIPLASPSGKKFKLTVDDTGTLSATEVTDA